MENDVSDLVIGAMMLVFGLIGLFLGSGAADAEMSIFGFSLTGFAICFDFGLLRRYFDRRDALLAATRERVHV